MTPQKQHVLLKDLDDCGYGIDVRGLPAGGAACAACGDRTDCAFDCWAVEQTDCVDLSDDCDCGWPGCGDCEDDAALIFGVLGVGVAENSSAALPSSTRTCLGSMLCGSSVKEEITFCGATTNSVSEFISTTGPNHRPWPVGAVFPVGCFVASQMGSTSGAGVIWV